MIKATLKELLVKYYGNQSAVARALGCSRVTLRKYIDTNGFLVLEDGRVFKDTGKILNGDR